MSDEEDSDGEAGLPSWVFWMIGGLIVFGVGFGSLGQMVGLWLGVLGTLSSLVLGLVPGSPLPPEMRQDMQKREAPKIDY